MSEPGLHSVFDMLLKGEESGWIQMLIFAVLIGASAVSSIVRSRKQKRDLEEVEEEGMPARKPPAKPLRRQEPSRAVQQRPESRPIRPEHEQQRREPARRQATGRAQPRTIIRPGSALGAFVAEIKAEIKRAGEDMQGIKTPPAPVLKAREPVKAVSKPPVQIDRTQHFVPQSSQPEDDDLSVILPQFSGPDDLKRAVLYLEILGKPVSMRGPGGQVIGL